MLPLILISKTLPILGFPEKETEGPPPMKVLIITPVRNEEQFIATTIQAMAKQTILPDLWVIVDDGSDDRTGEIIQEESANLPFIKYLRIQDRGFRKPGGGVVDAFYSGFDSVSGFEFDVVAKFDGDLDFQDDLIELLIEAFQKNPKLGVTGGTRIEQIGGQGPLKEIAVPEGYVGGMSKFYRRECFEDIEGLVRRAGWDGVDTIKANMHGWETGHIGHIKIHHLRPTGTAVGEGLRRAGLKYGNTSYYMGGYFWHFLLHVLKQSLFHKSIRLGYSMLDGFFSAMKNKEPRESTEFRKTVKKRQIRNLKKHLP